MTAATSFIEDTSLNDTALDDIVNIMRDDGYTFNLSQSYVDADAYDVEIRYFYINDKKTPNSVEHYGRVIRKNGQLRIDITVLPTDHVTIDDPRVIGICKSLSEMVTVNSGANSYWKTQYPSMGRVYTEEEPLEVECSYFESILPRHAVAGTGVVLSAVGVEVHTYPKDDRFVLMENGRGISVLTRYNPSWENSEATPSVRCARPIPDDLRRILIELKESSGITLDTTEHILMNISGTDVFYVGNLSGLQLKGVASYLESCDSVLAKFCENLVNYI